MPDKKLTDKEIPNVKELLEYKAKAHCELCDLKHLDCCNTCIYTAIKQFIELFNRLQEKDETRHKVFETKCEELEIAKAENERLKAEKDNLIKNYRECQVDNLKEFAKLCIDKSQNGIIQVSDMPDYVIEMVGEDNGKM